MIGKGCTCENTFTIPFAEDEIEAIRITYCQNDEIILEKELGDCSFSEGAVSVTLNQEDTLKFDSFQVIEIQLKVKVKGGSVVKSNIIKTITDKVLSCEVI